MNRKEERHSHPSYGMVSFSRRQGNPGRLFGSPLQDHGSYVTLSVRRAELIREDFYDRFYGSMRGDLFEVDMSAAQFAELLTTMNVGAGVPCTISYVNSQRVERPPEIQHEVEKVRAHFKEGLETLTKDIEGTVKDIRTVLAEKKNLLKEDRERISNLLHKVLTELKSNVPYTLDLFQEATEKVVVHAKAEVDAFVTANVMAAGLKAVLEGPREPAPPQLPPADVANGHLVEFDDTSILDEPDGALVCTRCHQAGTLKEILARPCEAADAANGHLIKYDEQTNTHVCQRLGCRRAGPPKEIASRPCEGEKSED